MIGLVCLLMQGCAKHTYNAAPINLTSVTTTINSWTINNPRLMRFLEANNLTTNSLQSNVFSMNRLFLTGLYYDLELLSKVVSDKLIMRLPCRPQSLRFHL